MLPLQKFDNIPIRMVIGKSTEEYRGGARKAAYSKDEQGRERRVDLHIPGVMSTNRPGHFKRLDSEARIGDGHGAEEVEDRI